AVPAGGIAKLAADTFCFVYAGDDFVVEIEVFPFLYARKAFPTELGDGGKTFFGHPVGETVDHLFDDAIAVVHDCGTDLNAVAAEEKEFDSIAPIGDAGDAGERQGGVGIGLNLLNHVQRDGLYGRTAIAAMGGLTVDAGARDESVEINAGDGVNG